MSTQLSVEPSQNLAPSLSTLTDHLIEQVESENTQSLKPRTIAKAEESLALIPSSSLANRTDVSINNGLDIVFNKNVQIGSGVIELHKADDNSLVESFKNGVGSAGGHLFISGDTLMIKPAAELTPNTRYDLTFALQSIQDLDGNPYTEYRETKPLQFSTTSTAPSTKLTPFIDQQTIPFDQSSLRLYFDQNIKLGSGQIELHKSSDQSLVESISIDAIRFPENIFAPGGLLTLDFKQPLTPNTRYYLTFSDQALLDTHGKAFTELPKPEQFTFATTALLSENLELNLINLSDPLSTTSDINLYFNKALKVGSGQVLLHNGLNGSVVESFTDGKSATGGLVSDSKATGQSLKTGQITVNPSIELLPNTQYYLTFSDDALTDEQGHPQIVATDTTKLSISGPPPDQQGPAPADNRYTYADSYYLKGDLPSTVVTVYFNDKIKLESGEIVLHKASDNSIVETFRQGIGSNEGYITTEDDAFRLFVFTPLDSESDYYLTIGKGALSDPAGNTNSEIIDPYAIRFTATQPSTVEDHESFWSVHDNSIGLAIDTNLYISFYHDVQLGSGAIVLHNADDGSIVETFVNGIGSLGGTTKVENSSIVINPGDNLKPATQFYLTVEAGAILDDKGTAFQGFTDSDTINFFTAEPDHAPPLLTRNDINHQNNLPRNANYTLFFNEDILWGDGTIELHKMADHSLVESFKQGLGSLGGSANISKSNITLDPYADLIADTEYYLSISNTALTDISGNAFAGFSAPEIFNFKTQPLDSQAPVLTSLPPVNPPVQNTIKLSFSESVTLGNGDITLHKASDQSVVETFSNGTGSAGGYVSASKQYNNDGVVIIDPAANLMPNTQYYLTISEHAIVDSDRNNYLGISNPQQFSFTTASAGPIVDRLVLSDYAMSSNIDITFSDAIRLGSGDITLRRAIDNSVVETFAAGNASSLLTVKDRLLSINPSADLGCRNKSLCPSYFTPDFWLAILLKKAWRFFRTV